MRAAAPPPPPPPPPDVPRHVADLSDVQRCDDSKKDDLMDRTDANTRSWIAFRFSFYMALITRCNVWTQLNTLNPFTAADPCVLDRCGREGHAGEPGADTTTLPNGVVFPALDG